MVLYILLMPTRQTDADESLCALKGDAECPANVIDLMRSLREFCSRCSCHFLFLQNHATIRTVNAGIRIAGATARMKWTS